TPFTSADVIATFDRALAESTQSVRKVTVESVLDGYEAVDDYTVKVYYKSPSGIFLTEALGPSAVLAAPVGADVDPADWPTDGGSTGIDPSRVIGAGPFKFDSWDLGQTVTIVKNEDYCQADQVPNIDRFIYQVVGDANTVLASLQTGGTDV